MAMSKYLIVVTADGGVDSQEPTRKQLEDFFGKEHVTVVFLRRGDGVSLQELRIGND